MKKEQTKSVKSKNSQEKNIKDLYEENRIICEKLSRPSIKPEDAAQLIRQATANLKLIQLNANPQANVQSETSDVDRVVKFNKRAKRKIEDIPLDERTGILELKDVKKEFKGKKVLKGVNAEFKPGHVYGFLGNNGAGKTTTMRILFNMEQLSSGSIVYRVKDVDKDGKIIEKEIPHKDIDFSDWFYFTEIDAIPTNYTVHNYLWELAILYDMPLGEFNYRERDIMQFLNVNFKLTNKISSLSSGQQKLVNCIALLLIKPNIVFLDEPTANMDVWNQKIIMKIIEKMKSENRIIVITTHLLKEVGDVLTDAIILDEGKTTYQTALTKKDDLQKIFRAHTTDTTEQDFANIDSTDGEKRKKTYEHNSFDRKHIREYLND